MKEARAFVADFLAFDPKRVLAAYLLVTAGALAEGFSLVLVVPLLDSAAAPADARTGGGMRLVAAATDMLGLDGRLGRVGLIIGAFAAAMILRALILARRQLMITRLQRDYLARRQLTLVETLGTAPWSSVSRLRHTRVTHLLGNDVYRLSEAATELLQCIVAITTLAIQLAIALALTPRLTLVACLACLVAVAAAASLLAGARELGMRVTQANLSLLNDAGQFLAALKIAISHNLQHLFVTGFAATIATITDIELAFVRRQARTRLALTLVAVFVASITAFVGFGVLRLRPAIIIAVLLLFSRMSGPLGQLQGGLVQLARALPAFGHMRALEDELRTDAPPAPDPGPPLAFADVTFDAVGFRHGGGATRGGGLEAFTLTLGVGGFLGIAGPSGAGKTTFADLLVGLYDPSAGTVRVGGRAVRLARMLQWRDQLAYVPQDSVLQHESVRANLLWGNAGATPAALARALAISGAAAFVARLPQGLDTTVGERGSLVSGGERQRLAIARALLREPRLLILDEATNAIDLSGEQELLARLDALRPQLTIVMIAHRPDSLRFCDTVAVIEAGRLKALGTFAAMRRHVSRADWEAPAADDRDDADRLAEPGGGA